MKYRTVEIASVAETEEKKSRFIASLVPIEEFETSLATLRVEHRRANHHVTAFRRNLGLGQVQEIGKDDGEPSGTSGMPVLKTMIGAGLMDCAIIVTRYFGGIKLGTGGLARAYSNAASEAIGKAHLIDWIEKARGAFLVPFDQVAVFEQRFSIGGLVVVDRQFCESGCTFTVEGDVNLINALSGRLTDPKRP